MDGILTIKLGGVNCYLVAAGDSFVLIDNGTPEKRARLEAELAAASCSSGDLKLQDRLCERRGSYNFSDCSSP